MPKWTLRTSRRPRLLVVVPSEEVGGAERYAARVALAAKDQWEVRVAVRRGLLPNPIRAELEGGGVKLLVLARGRRLRGLLGFALMIRLYKPRVVHLTLPWPLAAMEIRLACALTKVPLIAVHQLVPDAEELVVAHPRLYAWAQSRSQKWVAVSEFGRRTLAHVFGIDPSEIDVIRNAPRPVTRRSSSERQGGAAVKSRDGQRVVVSVGRLSHEKGHDLLIKAAAELAPRLPNLLVLIAGVGPAREELERSITERGLDKHVQLLGQVADVSSLLRTADLFAFPSRMEGTPFALLEAMRECVPVVATRFGGADEIIESQQTGVLIPKEDPRALAQAIDSVLGDPGAAREMARRGREAVDSFSEQTMLAETMSLLHAAANC